MHAEQFLPMSIRLRISPPPLSFRAWRPPFAGLVPALVAQSHGVRLLVLRYLGSRGAGRRDFYGNVRGLRGCGWGDCIVSVDVTVVSSDLLLLLSRFRRAGFGSCCFNIKPIAQSNIGRPEQQPHRNPLKPKLVPQIVPQERQVIGPQGLRAVGPNRKGRRSPFELRHVLELHRAPAGLGARFGTPLGGLPRGWVVPLQSPQPAVQ